MFLLSKFGWRKVNGKRKTKWRGHIAHVPSNEKRYFSNLFDIILFILPYLEKIGIRVSIFWQIVNWYKSKRRELDKEGEKIMAIIEYWIQLENKPWDAAPRNIDRLSGETIQEVTGQAPVSGKQITSPMMCHSHRHNEPSS